MNQDDNDTATLVLTLEPFVTEAADSQEAALKEPQAPDMDIWTTVQQNTRIQETATTTPAPEPTVVLTPEGQKMMDDFAIQIDLKDSNMVLQYGASAQKKIADFSEGVLDHVKTKDSGEIDDMLTGVVKELKSLEPREESKGFFGLFKRSSGKLDNMRAKYDKVKTSVDRTCKVLENHQIQPLRNIVVLDKMYELNTDYFKELSVYTLAGKERLEQVQTVELPALARKAEQTGQPENAQAANDMASLCGRFEKKIHDLELTRMVSLQMVSQTRPVQSNNTLISEKTQSTIVNTIPLWRGQMVLAVDVNYSSQVAKAQRGVTNMTNKLLRKNVEVLRTATIETVEEFERGIVDIETLKTINQSLITTPDEVVKIQTEGREERRATEQELTRMERELKQKLLEMSRQNPTPEK